VGGSEILEGWEGRRIKVSLASGGSLEGELVRSDAVGVLFSIERLTRGTPVGEVAAEVGEEATTAYCFLPWAQIQMMIPFPGALP
jgi:hypothetical protein